MKTANSNRPASVWPSTKYRSSFPECFTSGATIRGWLKNICSHSDPVTPCPSQFFRRLPGSHSNPVHFDNRSSGSIPTCIYQIYTPVKRFQMAIGLTIRLSRGAHGEGHGSRRLQAIVSCIQHGCALSTLVSLLILCPGLYAFIHLRLIAFMVLCLMPYNLPLWATDQGYLPKKYYPAFARIFTSSVRRSPISSAAMSRSKSDCNPSQNCGDVPK